MGNIQVLEDDYPWTYEVWAEEKATRNASHHYKVMSTEDGFKLPINEVLANDALVFHWVTAPLMPIAIQMAVEGWGLQYVTIAFNWVKRNRKNSWFIGNGHYTRANSELCLLFKKGRGLGHPADRSIKQIVTDNGATPNDVMGMSLFPLQVITQPGKHSQKPESVYEAIERMYPNATKLRLFARDQRPGWVSLGNEVTGNDIRVDLARFATPDTRPTFWAGSPRGIATTTVA